VPDFLSPAWIAELDRAARASSAARALPLEGTLVIEQRIYDVPRAGMVVFHLRLGSEGLAVMDGAAVSPDAVFTTDYAEARAIHEGHANAQHALADGRLKIRGDLRRLLDESDTLRRLDDVFASVRATTTFPADDRIDPSGDGH